MANSVCIEKISHEKCGSSDALQVFQDESGKYSGYCFSCNEYVHDPYSDKEPGYKPVAVGKTREQIQKELEEISTYQVRDLTDRKLKKATLDYFGIKVGVSEQDGVSVASHHYPYYKDGKLSAYKTRIVEGKRFFTTGDMKEVSAFGWEQAVLTGAKRLYICCGEIDTASLFKVLKDFQRGTQYANDDPAVIGVPKGEAHAPEFISKNYSKFRKMFKEVVYVPDQDGPGIEAAKSVSLKCPGILIAELPCKDVNEGLVKGISKRIAQAVLFQSSKPKNTRIVQASELFEAAKEKPVMGYSWPWKHLTKTTRGIRLGETIYIGSSQKMGKSDVVNTLIAHFIKEHGWKVFAVKPEENNKKTIKMVANKLTGKFYHDPEKEFDMKAFDQACKTIGDNLILLNLFQTLKWETVKHDIREAVNSGCKAVFLDPLTNFVNGMDSGEANTHLQLIAQEAAEMAADLDIVMFLTCHVKAPESGPDHTRGGKVLSSQFAGSRAMARSCNLMLGIEGNKDPQLSLEERNMRWITLLEDREFGESGRFQLYWDHNTGLFQEISV